jgi:hypothetical protein
MVSLGGSARVLLTQPEYLGLGQYLWVSMISAKRVFEVPFDCFNDLQRESSNRQLGC